ncbi:MAG: selenocysteine-specific translation elongation factor [Pirellulaceae bacterium]
MIASLSVIDETSKMAYTIVGVIGHIDHGKTSLVAALTGVDTDTHPEEKRRGITIDLGFAAFQNGDDEFALIDAPGHQKYIGNLLAGVSSIDVGLLVVACDQGIQEQTLEHAAILQNLGVKTLIVAVSRIDLSDADTLTELTEELQVFLADYGFQDIPVLPISSVTGQGLEDLKTALANVARTETRNDAGYFRMPIDRVFSVPGRGCVIAGTVWSGRIKVGDMLQVAGTSTEVRVRELEVHGETVSTSKIGRRTAMNVTGVSASDLHRGNELVAPNSYRTTKQHVVAINMFRDTSELKIPATVHLHTATTACEARITGVRVLRPTEQAAVVIETDEAIVTSHGQQFLLRRPYPVGSFASGRFLASLTEPQNQKRDLVELGQRLSGTPAAERLLAWVDFWGEIALDPAQLELVLGIEQKFLSEMVANGVQQNELLTPRDKHLVSNRTVSRTTAFTLKLLAQQAQTSDDAWMVEESLIKKLQSTGSDSVAKLVIDQLVQAKKLVRLNQHVAIASDETSLSKKQRARMEQIIAMFAETRTPPTLKELAGQLDCAVDVISSPVRFATQQRILTDLGKGFLISTNVFHQLLAELRALFVEQSNQSVTEIKDRWQVTRKHAIPLLEYCDQMQFTVRDGNQRQAGPNLENDSD